MTKLENNISNTQQKRRITSEEFINIWNKSYLNNPSYEEFYDKQYSNINVKFSNYDIIGDIVYKKNDDTFLPSLILDNTTIEDLILIDFEESSLHISNKTQIKNLTLRNTSTHVFCRKSLIGKIEIEGGVTNTFSVENSTIGDISIDNSKTGIFFIEDNSTIGDLYMDEGIVGSINILNSKIGNISIRNIIISSIYIAKSEAQYLILKKIQTSQVKIIRANIPLVIIENESFIEHFIFQLDLNKPSQIIFRKSLIRHLDFSDTILPEFTNLNISDCKIQQLSLKKYCNLGNVFFSNLIPQKRWKIFKKDENGSLQYKDGFCDFEDIEEDTILSIIDSDLGKTQFINCNLAEFNRFDFANSKILDIFIAGTKLPEKITSSNEIIKEEQERLAFGQFKKIYESRGDTPMSIRYWGFEMEAYQKLLKREKLENYPITGSQRQNWSERFLLICNRYSNNFGRSWIRGIASTFIAATVCYTIFCMSLGFRIGTDDTDWNVFKELFSFAPQYLNPLRDVDSGPQVFKDSELLSNVKMNFCARLWDYFSRVIVAFFVYQTIQSFRKLGKSNG